MSSTNGPTRKFYVEIMGRAPAFRTIVVEAPANWEVASMQCISALGLNHLCARNPWEVSDDNVEAVDTINSISDAPNDEVTEVWVGGTRPAENRKFFDFRQLLEIVAEESYLLETAMNMGLQAVLDKLSIVGSRSKDREVNLALWSLGMRSYESPEKQATSSSPAGHTEQVGCVAAEIATVENRRSISSSCDRATAGD